MVEVVGATFGSVAPAVPTVMYPIVSASMEVALRTTAETSDRPITGLLVIGTSKLLLIDGRVVPPSGFRAGDPRVDDTCGRGHRDEQPGRRRRRRGARVDADEVDQEVATALGVDRDRPCRVDGDDCLVGDRCGEPGGGVEVRGGRSRAALGVDLPEAGNVGDRGQVHRHGARAGGARHGEVPRLACSERGDPARVEHACRRCEGLEPAGRRGLGRGVVAEQVDDDVAATAAVDVNHTVRPDRNGDQVRRDVAGEELVLVDVEVRRFRARAGVRPHGPEAGSGRRCDRQVEHDGGDRAGCRERSGTGDGDRDRAPGRDGGGLARVEQALRGGHRHVCTGGSGSLDRRRWRRNHCDEGGADDAAQRNETSKDRP